eukprot:1475811-Alexandrium_andersonii.AAC.1
MADIRSRMIAHQAALSAALHSDGSDSALVSRLRADVAMLLKQYNEAKPVLESLSIVRKSLADKQARLAAAEHEARQLAQRLNALHTSNAELASKIAADEALLRTLEARREREQREDALGAGPLAPPADGTDRPVEECNRAMRMHPEYIAMSEDGSLLDA